MSRGPGRVERAIASAWEADPTHVFTTQELCRHVYGRLAKIEKKHRVSLVRAAKRVLEREPNWRMERTNFPGAPFIYFNEALAKENPDLKSLAGTAHTPSDHQRDFNCAVDEPPVEDEAELAVSTNCR